MTTTSTGISTAVPCPNWCTTDHTDMPPGAGFHAGHSIDEGGVSGRLWLTDQPGARPGVVIAGQVLSEADAHELGLALVRSADVLRRTRMAQEAAR